MSQEVLINKSEFIVSKTDIRGKIKYINKTFVDVSGFAEEELIGRPHSLIRHEMMPRCVFQYFWDTIQTGKEMFAYVVNKCKNGDYYWVLAYVTPDLDPVTGEIIGYHSVRRSPSRKAVEQINVIYKKLVDIERRQSSKRDAIAAGTNELFLMIEETGLDYEAWIYSLEGENAFS